MSDNGIRFEYSKPANKFFIKHEDIRAKFEASAKQVTFKIHPEQVNYRPLHGKFKGYSRIAIGGYRVIYRVINDEIIVIDVSHAGPRGDVYKSFNG